MSRHNSAPGLWKICIERKYLNNIFFCRLGDAEHALRNLHIVKKGRKKQAWEKDLQYAHALLTGYEGLVYYTRWRQISTQLDECMKLPFGSSSQTDHEQSMKNYADRANKCFEKICSNKVGALLY